MPYSLPFFMDIYMKKGGNKKINPSNDQAFAIIGHINRIGPQRMSIAATIKNIETEIALYTIFGTGENIDIKAKIYEVAKLRKKLTMIHINCLKFFKQTLHEEQFLQMIEIAKQDLTRPHDLRADDHHDNPEIVIAPLTRDSLSNEPNENSTIEPLNSPLK